MELSREGAAGGDPLSQRALYRPYPRVSRRSARGPGENGQASENGPGWPRPARRWPWITARTCGGDDHDQPRPRVRLRATRKVTSNAGGHPRRRSRRVSGRCWKTIRKASRTPWNGAPWTSASWAFGVAERAARGQLVSPCLRRNDGQCDAVCGRPGRRVADVSGRCVSKPWRSWRQPTRRARAGASPIPAE